MTRAMYPPMNGQGPNTLLDEPEMGGSIGRMLDATTDHIKARTAESKAGIAGGVLKGLFGGDTQTSNLPGVGDLLSGVGKAWEGVGKSFNETTNFLMGLMNNPSFQKGSGNTDNNMMMPWMMAFMMYMMQHMQQPRQDNTIPLVLDYMNKMVEQNNLRWLDREQYMAEKMNDWKEKAMYQDPISAQFQNQVIPTFVSKLVDRNEKTLLQQLKELKEGAEALGGTFNLFGNGHNEYTPERLQYEGIQLKKAQMFSDERKHMATIDAGHKKWKQVGDTLGQIFGGNEGGGPPVISFANMVQGLAGQQPGRGAMA